MHTDHHVVLKPLRLSLTILFLTHFFFLTVENEIFIGNGHGGWSPNLSEKEPWLQVDFGHYSEVKGIITQVNEILNYHKDLDALFWL